MTLTKKEENQVNFNQLGAEVNLLILPFFALTTNEIPERKKVEFRSEVTRNGERIEIFWRVSANTEVGYPGPLAKSIHKAIERKIQDFDLPIKNPIKISTYELCKRVGKRPGGNQYKRIKRELKRIKMASIESKGSFYHKGKQRYIEKVFSLYDEVVFKGEKLEDGRIAETNYIYLNRFYLSNINNRYIKPLDFEYCQDLQSRISQRLYEILGVKFYYIVNHDLPWIRYRYSTLCELLPSKRQQYLSRAKQILNRAHDELYDTDFLADYRWEDTGEKRDWLIYYFPGDRAKKEIKAWELPTRELSLSKPPLSEGRQAEFRALKTDIMDTLEDTSSERFYEKVVRSCPPDLIYRILSEVKDEARRGNIKKSKGAFFTYRLKKLCEKKGIKLGFKVS